jgi:hypothetical protein|tara:strand:- start:857 stop:1132 length:276 start_codon:yes stop_codon:yes gene_type:complete
MQSKIIKISILALSLGMLGGCAAPAANNNGVAEAALAKAQDAYNLATNAHEMASEASYAAGQAQNTADAAMECCNQNSQKLDRMFEKAMMK